MSLSLCVLATFEKKESKVAKKDSLAKDHEGVETKKTTSSRPYYVPKHMFPTKDYPRICAILCF